VQGARGKSQEGRESESIGIGEDGRLGGEEQEVAGYHGQG
jgi:hypothetical protein